MKHILSLLLVGLLIVSCGKETADLIVKGSVKDLQKGTLYLQKTQDSIVITLDSVLINGTSEFELHSELEEPEILYLVLDNNSKVKQNIPFFAEKGTTEITTTLKRFVTDAKIKGSNLQDKLEAYQMISKRRNDQNLDIIKNQFEAQKTGDTTMLNTLEKKANALVRIRYFDAINFALNNKNSQVAPYIALSEIYNAKLKYLDTIYKALPDSISNSKYGIQLHDFIKERQQIEDSITAN